MQRRVAVSENMHVPSELGRGIEFLRTNRLMIAPPPLPPQDRVDFDEAC